MSSGYLENGLSPQASDIHRALASFQEELEAIDYYNQRMDRTEDADLKGVLRHNRDEEIEHAVMALEWLRRRMPEFDRELREWIFTDRPLDHAADDHGGEGPAAAPGAGTLGIGRPAKEGK